LKYIYTLIAGVIIGAFLFYYFAPPKEKIVIKYKDKIVTQDKIVTEVKTITKEGEVKVVTKTKINTVEKEKIKEIDKLKIIKHKHQVAVISNVGLEGIHSVGLMYYRPFVLGFDIGLGAIYNLDNNYNVSINSINTSRTIDRVAFLISVKYNF